MWRRSTSRSGNITDQAPGHAPYRVVYALWPWPDHLHEASNRRVVYEQACVVQRDRTATTARVQAATASDLPMLFRNSAHPGHGIGSPLKERNAEQADVLAFVFDRLGMVTSRALG